MKNYYYIIWSDAILSFRKYHPDRNDWKFALLFLNTWINALNWWIIFIWLKFFKILIIPLLSINIFPGTLLNDFLSFSVEFALPFGVLNYYMIFYKNRYEKIIKKYHGVKIRYALIYSYTIVILALISAILYGTLN
jgi:hypothetical protein